MRRENLLDIKYLNRDGDSMRGPLALAGEPILDAHAATKRYIDTVLANLRVQAILRDGSQAMMGPLSLSGVPTLALHAASKAYVDGLFAGIVAAYATTVYVDAGDAAERVYSDAQDALRLLLAGGTMGGDLTLAGAPTNALHATPMNYVDTADALRLLLAGGTMVGTLVLAGAPANPLEAATKGYVDGVIPPGSLDTYDAVVAAAGGDYTSIVTACATEAAGARIFVKPGTYSETANIVLKSGQLLEGQNPDDTIIDFGAANRKITNPGGCINQAVKNLTVQGSFADYTIQLQGEYARVDNCRVIGTVDANNGIYLFGDRGMVTRTHITGFSKAAKFAVTVLNRGGIVANNTITSCNGAIYLNSDCIAVGNHLNAITLTQVKMESSSVLVGNRLEGGGNSNIVISGPGCLISGNVITGSFGIVWDGAWDFITITGNYIISNKVECTDTGVEHVTITGNTFSAGAGISIAGQHFTVSGNTFSSSAFINLTANAKYCVIIGNNLGESTNKIVDAGVANLAKNNNGVPSLMEKSFTRMKNTSGGALVAGDSVVFKAVAAGDEFTTTVNQGDDMAYGMLDENIADNAYGYIQDEGKTARLKVNGVVNVAIGDLLGTFTAAGISMKAASGDMAFAIALEVYAGADSNGVIDALLITPRKI